MNLDYPPTTDLAHDELAQAFSLDMEIKQTEQQKERVGKFIILTPIISLAAVAAASVGVVMLAGLIGLLFQIFGHSLTDVEFKMLAVGLGIVVVVASVVLIVNWYDEYVRLSMRQRAQNDVRKI